MTWAAVEKTYKFEKSIFLRFLNLTHLTHPDVRQVPREVSAFPFKPGQKSEGQDENRCLVIEKLE